MKTFRNIISLSLITFLSGCGGDSKPVPTTVTGIFIDDIVQGLDYECSSGLSGKTNIRGEYVCGVGDQVTFSVNEITIGTTTAQSIIVSPYTFFPHNYDAAINLARLLQSIDNDGDSGNGVIQVNPDISLPPSLDFASPNFDTEVAIDLVSASIATQQLNENIVEHGGSVPAPPPDTTDPDTSAPTAPTLLTSLLTTNQNTLGIDVSGKIGTSIWINKIQQGTIGSDGKSSVTLDTSGSDGNKAFSITLKDANNNESSALSVSVIKDTTAPVITLRGDNPAIVHQNSIYTDGGATANDAVDGSAAVTTAGESTIDTTKLGDYKLTYTSVDKTNNIATITRTVSVIEAPDTMAPTTPALLSSILITNQETLGIEISGEPGASIWINNTQQGTIGSNGKSAITLDTSGEDGNKAFRITLKDASNNKSSALSVSVIKDTTAPVITLRGDNPAIVHQNSVYTDGGATANDAVDGTAAVTTAGESTIDTTELGDYKLTYTSVDKTNNMATITRTVSVIEAPDTMAPTTPALLSSILITNQETLGIEISGEPGASIWINNTQQGTIGSNGKSAITLDTSGEDGNKAFRITLKDASNNKSSPLSVSITKDTIVPIITLKGDNPITVHQGSNYTDAGATANDNIDGVVAVTTEDEGAVDTSKLGDYELTYTSIDKANNKTTKTRTISVIKVPDTTAPTAPVLLSSLLTTNQDTLQIQISGEPAATIWVHNTQQGTIASNGKSVITLDTSGEDGNKAFRVTLKDTSENESEALAININKDTVEPNTNAKISKLQTADTSPALSGQLPSGNNDTDTTDYTIKILVNGVEYAASNDEDGNWELAANSLDMLEEGFYNVTVITTDAAGNTSSTVLTNAIEINNSGFLIDSALEGIKYVSGKYSGYTDKNGLFKYENDQEVRFYIGDESTGIELGSTKVKSDPFADRKVITVFDLAGSQDEENHVVINMGRFLQSLDSDNDVSNGILIDVRSKESIALLGLNNRIDFKSSTEDFAAHSDIESLFNDLAEHFGEHRGLISAEDAQAHLVSVRDNTLPVQKYGLETSRGNKEETVISTGIFKSTNGVVEGIDFRSGNQFGRTNEKGEFSYVEGGTVKFSIYELVLGTTQSKAVITPADMVRATSFNHPKPRNIIRLLNTFDADSTDDRISIDHAVRTALEKYRSQIDINLPDGRANEELGIEKGEDEFGAQFEDFELGQEILNKINTLRTEG